jgi:two-component system alkaline phosphatase synthesis response regulator PhoP
VTVDGQPVDLTPIEFDLLSLLMSSPGRVFSSAYLLETVWKDDYIEGDRSLDAVMLRLCQKLGAVGTIETVFGSGYRLKPVR